MPSLIFHESSLKENNDPAINPNENSNIPKVFRSDAFAVSDRSARQLMWVAVVLLTLIICGLWAWSVMSQFYSTNWSVSPEKVFMDDLKKNWNKSFSSDSDQPLSTEQLKTAIKENLGKLFAAAASTTDSSALPATNTNITTNSNP